MAATLHLTSPATADGVSLAERVPALLALRTTAVAAWMGMQFSLAPSLVNTRIWLGALVFLVISAALSAMALVKNEHVARCGVPLSLLLDGLFFEGRYAHGAPLGGNIIVAVYVVAIVILLPARVAIVVGIWHSLLAVVFSHIIPLVQIEDDSADPSHNAFAFLGVMWLAILACAQLKALNERELRRRRHDAEALRRFALNLAGVEAIADVQRLLMSFCHDELKVVRSAWITPMEPHGFRLELGRNVATVPAPTDIGVSGLLSPLGEEIPARAVYRLGPGEEWLSRIFPDARRIVAAPLPGTTVPGWVVLEHGGRGNRLERRLISTVSQACAAAALACSSATVLDQLRFAAATDGLTGRANRRTFDNTMTRLRDSLDNMPAAIILADIDHFKLVNDQHGHQTGDEVLQAVGRILGQTARANDLVARYGGEEFVIVLPRTTVIEAAKVAERMRRRVNANGLPLRVSVSLGVADAYNALEFDDVVARADTALYRAKSTGRNRVMTDSRE